MKSVTNSIQSACSRRKTLSLHLYIQYLKRIIRTTLRPPCPHPGHFPLLLQFRAFYEEKLIKMDTFIPYIVHCIQLHVHNTTCTCMLYIITLNELI